MLKANKAIVFIKTKYVEFADIYSKDLVAKLPKYIKINNHAINLIKGQYLSYWPIYSLKSVELEKLTTSIKTNFANSFYKIFQIFFNYSHLYCQKTR